MISIDPIFIQYLSSDDSGHYCCPLCKFVLRIIDVIDDRTYYPYQYYCCTHHHFNMKYQNHFNINANFASYKFPKSNYYDYDVAINIKKDEINVELVIAHSPSIPYIRLSPIPPFNFFDTDLLVKKMNRYLAIS